MNITSEIYTKIFCFHLLKFVDIDMKRLKNLKKKKLLNRFPVMQYVLINSFFLRNFKNNIWKQKDYSQLYIFYTFNYVKNALKSLKMFENKNQKFLNGSPLNVHGTWIVYKIEVCEDEFVYHTSIKIYHGFRSHISKKIKYMGKAFRIFLNFKRSERVPNFCICIYNK